MRPPRVSILVPAHDPGALLAPLVDRVLDEQTYPHDLIQLVIVDDASTDGAADALRSQRRHDKRLVIHRAELRNMDAARNLARSLADGEVLAMTDHDCMPAADWLERAVAALRPDEILAGRIVFKCSAKPTIWELLDISKHLDQERYVRDGFAVTANLFVEARIFDRLGGLDPDTANGGDFEFVARAVSLGVGLRYAADAVISHPTRTGRAEYLSKQRRLGAATAKKLASRGRPTDLLWLLPGAPTLARAVRSRRPAELNPERLAEHGIQAGLGKQLLAFAAQVFVVGPAFSRAGVRELRRLRTARERSNARTANY